LMTAGGNQYKQDRMESAGAVAANRWLMITRPTANLWACPVADFTTYIQQHPAITATSGIIGLPIFRRHHHLVNQNFPSEYRR